MLDHWAYDCTGGVSTALKLKEACFFLTSSLASSSSSLASRAASSRSVCSGVQRSLVRQKLALGQHQQQPDALHNERWGVHAIPPAGHLLFRRCTDQACRLSLPGIARAQSGFVSGARNRGALGNSMGTNSLPTIYARRACVSRVLARGVCSLANAPPRVAAPSAEKAHTAGYSPENEQNHRQKRTRQSSTTYVALSYSPTFNAWVPHPLRGKRGPDRPGLPVKPRRACSLEN